MDFGYWLLIGLKSSEFNLVDCGLGCFCFNCDMILFVKDSILLLVVLFRKCSVELIWFFSISLVKILDLLGGFDVLSFLI